jgi:GcrA cell cycle regulator
MNNTVEWYLATKEERTELVRFYLKERGWSYGELAKYLGVTRNVIAGICNRNGIKVTDDKPKVAAPRRNPISPARHQPDPTNVILFRSRPDLAPDHEEAVEDMVRNLKERAKAQRKGNEQSAVLMVMANKREASPNPHVNAPRALREELWQPLLGSLPITQEDANSRHCRWPVSSDNKMCCGNHAVDGKPYCEAHCAIAYKPAPPMIFKSVNERRARA